jgi:hypothetical protein
MKNEYFNYLKLTTYNLKNSKNSKNSKMSTLENMSEIESSLPLATIEDILLNAKDKLNESSTLLGGKMYHIFEHKKKIYSQNVNYEKNNIQDIKDDKMKYSNRRKEYNRIE